MTWCYRLAVLAAAVAIGGCASDEAFDTGGTGPGGGGGVEDGAAVVFEGASPLSVAPGQVIELTVQTDPPGAYEVSFLLLGDALDASLDRSGAPTDVEGRAAVKLLAPSKAATFEVRAALGVNAGAASRGGAGEAKIVVQVDDVGRGELHVAADYKGGRELTTWRAAVVPQAKCDDLLQQGDPAGAETVEAPWEEEIVFDDAIVGPNLAVFVRAENKVWGCAETSLSHAGEVKAVTVPLLDRPIDLSEAALDVSLYVQDTAPLEVALDAADTQLLDAAFPESASAASLLLDAMTLQLPAEIEPLFAAARQSAELDAEIGDALALRDVEPRTILEELLRGGRPLPPLFLSGHLSSREADAARALLRVDTFAGVPAELAGVPGEHLLSLDANPGDTIVIGAESGVFFFPTRLVGALAERAALDGSGSATTFSAVLADAVGCLDLASVIGALGDCDVSCMEASCRLALGDIWAASLDASADEADVGVLTAVVSGPGVVDDEARLVTLDATESSWVGEVRIGEQTASIGGTALVLQSDDPAGDAPQGGAEDDDAEEGDDGAGGDEP